MQEQTVEVPLERVIGDSTPTDDLARLRQTRGLGERIGQHDDTDTSGPISNED